MRQRAWVLFENFGIFEDNARMRMFVFGAPLKSPRDFSEFWITILYSLSLPRRQSRVKEFLRLFSTAAFGFSYDPGTLNALAASICSGGFFIDLIVRDNYFLRSLANFSNLVNVTDDTPREVLFEQVSRLWRRGGDYIYPYETLEELWNVVSDSI
jgi:hypothetical protein